MYTAEGPKRRFPAAPPSQVPSMTRKGKERASSPVKNDRSSSTTSIMLAGVGAATSTTVDLHEAQWRAGVNRQARPDARAHQQAAAQALATMRKASAMSGEENEAAERRRADTRNKNKRAKRASEKTARDADLAQRAEAEDRLTAALDRLSLPQEKAFIAWRESRGGVNDEVDPTFELQLLSEWQRLEAHEFERVFHNLGIEEELGEREREDFHAWLSAQDLPPDQEALADWRSSPDYQCRKLERIAGDCRCEGECMCTYDSESLEPDIEGYNCDSYDSALLQPQPFDWQPSEVEREPDDADPATASATAAAPPPPPPPPPPAAPPCDCDEDATPEDATPEDATPEDATPEDATPEGTAPLPGAFAPTARARFFHRDAFSQPERLAAHTAGMPSGEAQHHGQLAPRLVQGAGGGVIMEAFDPEGEVPYGRYRKDMRRHTTRPTSPVGPAMPCSARLAMATEGRSTPGSRAPAHHPPLCSCAHCLRRRSGHSSQSLTGRSASMVRWPGGFARMATARSCAVPGKSNMCSLIG